jgi:hypothetical protein
LVLLFVGYLRDFVFKKLNALLQAWDHDMDYDMPGFMKFLTSYEYDTVLNIKWLLTFIFWAVYLVIAIVTVKLFFSGRQFLKITIATFVGILLISGTFMLIGVIFSSASDKMYEFARYLMGLAQSPVILMILIPLFKMYEKSNLETGVKSILK